ncbi:phosphatidylinositol 5-phosphate 4-kinase type-2 alpha-like [Tubulanus polymorphus]|uniref:phosphatidylinositol 5-phosphate 4-kinase type-2 alpha-like n=1 Tax=Tubulanus polymorphus TaxID=672921 RepID=UPI003DA5AA81
MSTVFTKKNKPFKAVSQKVKLFRANDPLLSVFMWGINHSFQELSHVNVPVMLLPDDFKAYTKTRKDNHLFNKENMPSHFKVKEYCPLVFRNLRERFALDEIDYMNSLTKSQPVHTDSPGRSGAKFYHSYDKRFVVKTLMSEEVEQLHHILREYHEYIVVRDADTLLPHYLGMYRVTVNDTETYLLVMRNVFSPRLPVHRKYDLKGSTVDRQASDKEKAKSFPTFKDNDFIRDEGVVDIGNDSKEKLMERIISDAEFLSKHNLMDYSLLIGIHDLDRGEVEESGETPEEENGCDDDDANSVGSAGSAPDSPGNCAPLNPFTGELDPTIEIFGIQSREDSEKKLIYFMAIIDILTHYGMKKRTAQAAKSVKHGPGAEISTVKPEQYKVRFLEFVSKNIQ